MNEVSALCSAVTEVPACADYTIVNPFVGRRWNVITRDEVMKMTIGLTFIVVSLTRLTALGQLNTDFRVVSNKVYNVQRSALWETMPPKSTFTGFSKFYHAKVVSINTNRLIVRIEASGDYAAGDVWNGRHIVIYNHPNKNLVTGEEIERDRYFPLGNVNITNTQGAVLTVKAYTYGQIYVPPATKK